MKKLILLGLLALNAAMLKAQIFIGEESKVSFYSKSSMEDIDAVNTVSKPIFNTANGELIYKLANTGFKFKSALMEEHFNENYMESEKYPHTIFKGKINEKPDYKKDGEYNVTVSGVMNMHGVEKTVSIPGKITVKGDKIQLNSTFKIKLADYNIKIPSVVTYNIAEEVDVTVSALLIPFKK